MKLSLSIVSSVVSIAFLFSGCSIHIIKDKSPVVVPIPKEPEPIIETPTVVEIPVMIEKKDEIDIPKKQITKKQVPNKKVTKKDETNEESEVTTTVIENLNQKMSENKTREVREILKENPKAIEAVGNSSNKLFYIGPSGWRVIDIIEGFRNKKLQEKLVVAHIKESKIPYKVYTYEEIQILLKNKIPYKVINAMMIVSR
ncbi:MAG: hypothetical protein PHW18_11820 [Sulfuricurvum sp.]|uniref:hypothetical protein n=1 Tax=Sulfuricurvum sp. TaxID=2025608 RepID=UPI00260ED61A|nr:hypothetical protein [Sulfuricurvum sp.]MDD2830251.1 hypothetical protein [Sulfuricurvum sp.]MDD4948783.1 hypothetical protein [Sulfuricurvum sp.]